MSEHAQIQIHAECFTVFLEGISKVIWAVPEWNRDTDTFSITHFSPSPKSSSSSESDDITQGSI